MDRRTLLAGCGVALLPVAGCLAARTERDLDGEIRPDDDPDVVPAPLVCQNTEYDRLQKFYSPDDLEWGESGEFVLRVSGLSFTYGDTVEIRLRNASNATEEIGALQRYNLEVYTEDGWLDVRVLTDQFQPAFPDDGGDFDPGDEFEWAIELTESGIDRADFALQQTTVCPELGSGRYRFVFTNQFGAEQTVAVAFDLQADG